MGTLNLQGTITCFYKFQKIHFIKQLKISYHKNNESYFHKKVSVWIFIYSAYPHRKVECILNADRKFDSYDIGRPFRFILTAIENIT